MPVFTALRNKARSTASGFLTKTAQSALGLNRAKGLRFNQPNTGPVTGNAQTTRGGEVLQYPLDLGTDGNSHFIAFFVKQIEPARAKIEDANNQAEDKKRKEAKKNTVGKPGVKPKTGGSRSASQNRGTGTTPAPTPKGADQRDKTAEAKELNKKQNDANRKAFGTGKKYLSIQEKTRPTSKLVKTIALYFPPSVQQEYSLSYNEQEISKQAAFGASVIQAFVEQGNLIDSFKASVDPALEGVKSVLNQMGISALDNIAKGSKALIALNRGKVLAPKMEVMFENIGKRSFSYSFTFTPSSEAEADEVQRIIQAFRFHASADYADEFGFELKIPDQFEIEYYTQNNSPNGYLNKIGTCVLEKVDVTYGGDKMTWHETNPNGAPPTKTTMALSFKELMTVTKSAIEDGF
tara:strand:+ start:354 stop:1574 length:1221 start_codon:yes stop_codon:yes gene_type:complete